MSSVILFRVLTCFHRLSQYSCKAYSCHMQKLTLFTTPKLPQAASGRQQAVLALLAVGVNVFAADLTSKGPGNGGLSSRCASAIAHRFQAEQERLKN